MTMNIFQNNTKSIPTSDNQIVRVDMEQSDIAGRKSHLPSKSKSPDMSVQHVASAAMSGK